MTDDNFLEHFGKTGMRWHHRKGASSPTEPAPTPKKISEDYLKKASIKGKKVSELSNAELKVFNDRAVLEKQYKTLTKAEISPGQKFVKDLFVNMAKQAVNQYSKKLVDDLMKKAAKE